MKTRAKRLLSILLSVLMVASTVAMMFPAVLSGAEDVSIQNGTGSRGPLECAPDVGYRAIVNGPFTGFGFAMPTWETKDAECTLSVFAWAGTYDQTVSAEPIASVRFAPMTDNHTNWVTFDEQPAGEYLFLISEVNGKAGVWYNASPTGSKGFLYVGGVEQRGEPELQIRFTGKPDQPFGTCKPSVTGIIPTAVNVFSMPIVEFPMSFSDSMAVRLNLLCDFIGFNFKMGTYYADDMEVTFSVYAWKGDYDSTVAEDPARTASLTLKDNAMQGIRFEALPAGEYLFMIHDAKNGQPALYLLSNQQDYPGIVYHHGYEQEMSKDTPEMQVVFTKEADAYFAKPTEATNTIDGNHTPPEEYVIPSDSKIYTHEVMPDTWVFTDALGRTSLTNAEVGDPRKDKTLAMFYWTWHVSGGTTPNPFNNQEFMEQHPEAINDYDNPLWPTNVVHFWNQPIYGYYRTDDTWVLRRQAEMLASAGVDVVFTDNTNGTWTWRDSYLKVFETWTQAMEDGVKTPKVSFMLPFSPSEDARIQLQDLYLDIFRRNKWQNLWYYLDGKPMLMAHKEAVSASASNTQKEILNFFTFRANDAGYMMGERTSYEHWGWLSMYPQAYYYKNIADRRAGKVEQITVGVAMNHNYVLHMLAAMNGENIAGRSYTSEGYHTEENAKLYGYNLAEQFNNALQIDPSIIFVTGWNEWKAGRYEVWPEGLPSAVENAFPDQCNDEYSRDIEPTWGDLKDNYYYELVNFVRQFKGARPIPTPTAAATIDLNAGAAAWENVGPYYAAYIGNTGDRDADGYGDLHYTEYSGRNDIIGARVARDDENIYFYVECNDNITPYTDPLWMVLYIDCDQQNQGWETFDYVLNKSAASADTAVLERFTGSGYASEKVADVKYKVDGKTMTVVVPKSALHLSGYDFTINFSWTDNVHDIEDKAPDGQADYVYTTFSGDLMNFYVSGDVAPGGRFKFSYVSTNENAGMEQETETETDPVTESEPDTETDPKEETENPETVLESETESVSGGCRSALSAPASVALSTVAAAAALGATTRHRRRRKK